MQVFTVNNLRIPLVLYIDTIIENTLGACLREQSVLERAPQGE
jgi:hypothetical protein